MSRPPLAGLRVLTVSQFGAGPFGTQVLADLGADVIKIEDPTVGGDIARYVPPFRDERDSLYFQSFNRGKKSLTLDLRRPDATGEKGLGFGNHSQKQRWQGECQDDVDRVMNDRFHQVLFSARATGRSEPEKYRASTSEYCLAETHGTTRTARQ